MSMNLIPEQDDDEEETDEEDVVLPLGFPTEPPKKTSFGLSLMDDLPKTNYGSNNRNNRSSTAGISGGARKPRQTYAVGGGSTDFGSTFGKTNKRNRQTVTEGMTKFIKPPSTESTQFFNSRAWKGSGMVAAPMVSGRRTLRLPNLNASKKSRRTTLMAANARLMREAVEDYGPDRTSAEGGMLLGEKIDEGEVEMGKPQSTPPEEEEEEEEDEKDLKDEMEPEGNPIILSILYGLINTLFVLPVMFSFGSIIYHDDFFRPYLAGLMKLTVISGAVHQIIFSTFSSLPFAVGQVQDVGLIFLSAMATDVVSRLKSTGTDDESILATLTIGLPLYTALMGCALVVIGKFQLASYCQLLPASVRGGYLGFIGFYCGQAGLALMAVVDVGGLAQWYKFFNLDALMLLAPGVAGGCAIYFSLRHFRGHMAVLPSGIVLLMVAFFAVLWATGTTVQEATDNGWINKTEQSPSWDHTWDFLKFEKVVWSVLPSQSLTLIAMIGVVALSSSLDIAAIEIELKRPLDYNHELKTVGLSNIVSGLTGGYSGSYIFSQTIFSLRSGIKSRLMGYILAFLMLVTLVMPINILAYVPNFFFGSLLMLICLVLMFERLIDVRKKVTPAEYVVVLSTFALLQILGVEFGIIGGVGLYMAIDKMGYDLGKDDE